MVKDFLWAIKQDIKRYWDIGVAPMSQYLLISCLIAQYFPISGSTKLLSN
jgi:hypothetical protein